MLKLFRYLKHYKLQSILGPLFKLTEACFELAVPLVMAKIIDVGIAENDSGYIIKMGLVLVLLGVLGLAASLTAQFFAARASLGFGTELRRDLFHHINTLSHKQKTIGLSEEEKLEQESLEQLEKERQKQLERENIDYFMISKTGITVNEYKVIDKTFDGVYPSDHFPIYLSINIK